MMRSLRILIADDHEVVRRGVRGLLEDRPAWDICGEAATGWEAVEKARQTKPDIVVLDISMPELNGLEATRHILKALPKAEVLIITIHQSEDLMREVLEAGARGYVLKSDAARDLVRAVESLAEHKPYFTAKVSEMVLDVYLKSEKTRKRNSLGAPLTPREREVLQLLAEGKSNKQVAALLGIRVSTAETHRKNIMNKVQIHSTSGLVHYAIRNKIVEP